MKTLLNHIAAKKVAKHVNRSKVVEIGTFLVSEGYTRDKLVFTKGRHQFVVSGHGNRWTVSHRKTMEVTA